MPRAVRHQASPAEQAEPRLRSLVKRVSAVRAWGMSEISVRVLEENDWQDYREVRLAALQESPQAFLATYAEEATQPGAVLARLYGAGPSVARGA